MKYTYIGVENAYPWQKQIICTLKGHFVGSVSHPGEHCWIDEEAPSHTHTRSRVKSCEDLILCCLGSIRPDQRNASRLAPHRSDEKRRIQPRAGRLRTMITKPDHSAFAEDPGQELRTAVQQDRTYIVHKWGRILGATIQMI